MTEYWKIYRIILYFSLPLLTYSLLDGSAPAGNGKFVSSSLEANWRHTSLLAETSEFIANEDPSGRKFWKFIDGLLQTREKARINNDKAGEAPNNSLRGHEFEYERSLSLAAPHLSDGSGGIPLLRFALALRLYSPRVQLHRQIASDLFPLLNVQKCSTKAPFYEINGAVGCAMSEIDSLLFSAKNRDASQLYSIDHIYPIAFDIDGTSSVPLVILYADISRPEEFYELHEYFVNQSQKGAARYVLRHFDAEMESSTPISLSGYGVELAIKSTEYKAIDDSNLKNNESIEAPSNLHGFNFKMLRDNYVHLREQLGQFQIHLAEMDELAPLKQWEIADIAVQAAQKVMEVSSEEAIPLLVDLSQNFPIRARTLVQTKVRPSFREEIGLNQQQWAQDLEMAEGESALWINGIPIADVESLDLFQLFQSLRQEQRLADAFMRLGYKRDYQSILHAMDLSEEKPGSWALDFREGKPEWVNNLDKDKQYADWGNSVRLLLQPYFPGMIRPIARNLFNLVCILDPTMPESRDLLKNAFSLYAHNVPMRIGFIFVVNDSSSMDGQNDLGVALFNVFQFVKADKSPAKAVHFLQKIFDEFGDSMDLASVHKFFKRHYTDQEVDDVFGANTDYGTGKTDGIAFYRRSGLNKLPAILVNGVSLDQSALESSERFEEAIVVAVMRQTSALQRAVIAGRLTDRENIQNWVMSQPDVLPRLNSRLLGDQQNAAAKKNTANAPPTYSNEECALKNIDSFDTDKISTEQQKQCILDGLRYLTRADETEAKDELRWLTIWVIADFDSIQGRQLLQNALKALKKSNQMRLALVHNGQQHENGENKENVPFSLLLDAILNRLSSTPAKQALNKLLNLQNQSKSDNIQQLLEQIAGHGTNMEPVLNELKTGKGNQRMALQSTFSTNHLGLTPGQRAVFVNGQVYGPLEEGEEFEPEDFSLMEKLAERRGAKAVANMVKGWQKEGKNPKETEENLSDTILHILSAVHNFAVRKRRQTVDIAMDFESVLNLLAEDEDRPVLEITAILDPLSRAAQKLAPILQTLMKVLNADLRLAMNPKQRLSELPLKRFYRYILREEPAFSPTGQLLPNIAKFQELPQKQLLTMQLIVPDSWMVQPVFAEHDLDNIRVATASNDIVARFQLRHILLEGHCFDEQTGNPPRGLQFLLGTRINKGMFDTIVMANLGYFQLKASPGAWILRLREGRSTEIYELKGSVDSEEGNQLDSKTTEMGDTDDHGPPEVLHVLVDSFSGKTIRVRVAKRKGMEKRNLLSEDDKGDAADGQEEEDGEESIWSNLAPKKVVKKLSSKLMGGEKYDKINIFSLASGHLYERFMRIMMLSVIKHTKHPVVFWLLNNYLSPQFRESLPVLAKHYGFDYQLIEYKWPRWLHQQTEKQRVMWGYKILFLDVLFPLDVKKIIFVDADQVVRTDLMELMELDLQGAPYGYTPFCNSRTSMDGFRFWKSGYWASHLAGRRYHISALYVVDLVKFRQIAAGDRLRGQYQGLSADPNSLANLDQDLPNNMIHQVRIHSLPQEWLWCETWCDDESKKAAKTIDLCNNPLTKEPKLDSAVRILPEWTDYDNEIRLVLDAATMEKGGERASEEQHLEKEKHIEL